MILQVVGVIGILSTSVNTAVLLILYKKLIKNLGKHAKLAVAKAAAFSQGYAVCDKCSLTVARYDVKGGKTVCQNCSGE